MYTSMKELKNCWINKMYIEFVQADTHNIRYVILQYEYSRDDNTETRLFRDLMANSEIICWL